MDKEALIQHLKETQKVTQDKFPYGFDKIPSKMQPAYWAGVHDYAGTILSLLQPEPRNEGEAKIINIAR